MSITQDQAVGSIASRHPLATRVFHRHGIDFCCGGGIPLAEACDRKGLAPATIIAELEKEIASTAEPEQRWDEAPLSDLIQHILMTYHEPLKRELPRLQEMARKVHTVHGDKDPENLKELAGLVSWLAADLEQHLMKEEEILFPMIKAGDGFMADGPIAVMEEEHEQAGAALRRIRELTGDFVVPAEACNTWRALWHGLESLEKDLHEHIHLENNILHKRALASEG